MRKLINWITSIPSKWHDFYENNDLFEFFEGARSTSFCVLLTAIPTLYIFFNLLGFSPVLSDKVIGKTQKIVSISSSSRFESAVKELTAPNVTNSVNIDTKKRSNTVEALLKILSVLVILYSCCGAIIGFYREFDPKKSYIAHLKKSLVATLLIYVLIITSLFVLMFAVDMVEAMLGKLIPDYSFDFGNNKIYLRILSVVSVFIAMWILYLSGTTWSKNFSDIWRGVLLVCVAFFLTSWAFDLWLIITEVNIRYGSLGGIIIIITWVYVNCIFILMGNRLNERVHAIKHISKTIYEKEKIELQESCERLKHELNSIKIERDELKNANNQTQEGYDRLVNELSNTKEKLRLVQTELDRINKNPWTKIKNIFKPSK